MFLYYTELKTVLFIVSFFKKPICKMLILNKGIINYLKSIISKSG